tara:strand:+ start:110 stop:439 length:330 start_codon:yes stop_codon:yes gene_type:complete
MQSNRNRNNPRNKRYNFGVTDRVPFIRRPFKSETRPTSNSCPEGYMDFRTSEYGSPSPENSFNNFKKRHGFIPNYCIETRARIRNNSPGFTMGGRGPHDSHDPITNEEY